MMSAMMSCGDWLNSTPAETKVEPFGLSLWSQRKMDSKSEVIHCIAILYIALNLLVTSISVLLLPSLLQLLFISSILLFVVRLKLQ